MVVLRKNVNPGSKRNITLFFFNVFHTSNESVMNSKDYKMSSFARITTNIEFIMFQSEAESQIPHRNKELFKLYNEKI
jgi:hypothetical protein